MADQLMLTCFAQKIAGEALEDFRPYNDTIIDWELDYRDYSEERGMICRTITVVVKEALVKTRDEKHSLKRVPGFVVIVYQEDEFEEGEKEEYLPHEATFTEQPKAVSEFLDYCLSAEGWAEIGESRAELLAKGLAGFECPFCGWCCEDLSKNEFRDTCMGCGKRFWDLG